MELSKALEHITEIHEQMAKGEVYRGYRPFPIALSGILGMVGGLLQEPLSKMFVHGYTPDKAFVLYWVGIAVISALPACVVIAWRTGHETNAFARRSALRVIGQFLPAVAAGAVVTAALFPLDRSCIHLLPGLWTLCFALGVFSSRPYLPRATGWVALFFLGGAVFLLTRSGNSLQWLGIALGSVFMAGQTATAAVLYFNVERRQA